MYKLKTWPTLKHFNLKTKADKKKCGFQIKQKKRKEKSKFGNRMVKMVKSIYSLESFNLTSTRLSTFLQSKVLITNVLLQLLSIYIFCVLRM